MAENSLHDLPEDWYKDKDTFKRVLDHFEWNLSETARVLGGIGDRGLSRWKLKHGFAKSPGGRKPSKQAPVDTSENEEGRLKRLLLASLKKLGDDAHIEDLANACDVSPRRVREILAVLDKEGYRVGVNEWGEKVVLDRVPPQQDHLHSIGPELFDGDWLKVGIVSDTHIGANEEALEELHLAYDMFVEEGVKEVWHAGDWGTGVGMFRTHHAEAKVHSHEEQVEYLDKNYPERTGITTRGISGNHDLEGDLGRVGADPVRALSNRRDDIEYLGEYSAWLEILPGTGSWVHLLHGSGGMSYAYSYKAQKLVDGYSSGRKPNALVVGHWHVRGNLRHRDVEIIWPGCFEWQSRFLKRLGLHPAVGFHILDVKVADDGSIVRWKPEWFPYYPGRKVTTVAL